MPFVWGRMAVCLNMWSYKPLQGEKNPLTHWSDKGLRSNPVGRVEMGEAVGVRVSLGGGWMLPLGLVVSTCAILA
jgi:hypothetical protein